MIRPGQVYRACAPVGSRRYIQIKVTHHPILTVGLFGYGKVRIVTLTDAGREIRPRAIECRDLHVSRLTEAGEERKTGYFLEEDV